MVWRPSIQGDGAGASFGFGDGSWPSTLWSMRRLVSPRRGAIYGCQLSPLLMGGFGLVDEDSDDPV
jgi:hypothetical protein